MRADGRYTRATRYTEVNDMQRFQRIGATSALKPGWVMEAEAGGETFAVINVDGEVRAFEGSFPCTGGPLGSGAIREGLLVCPWHGWRFDCESGVCHYNHEISIRRIPVKVEGDDILIQVPDNKL